MNNKSLKKKVSPVDMIVKFLEKDLSIMKKIDSKQIELSDIESILTQSLLRINRFKAK
ncbi:hypothetical protein [Aliivibrio salmonicida]|uniref:hypothetical protein n=1 Tax=Aliivibrio salmonicida TaxID=40269 RepID=UPI003D128B02